MHAGARVLPYDNYEELLFNGITADVWMQEGVTEQNLRANMAGFYRREDPTANWLWCWEPATSRRSCRLTSWTA